jgi:tetrahydromethanopterin S-methyltransferase subunit B
MTNQKPRRSLARRRGKWKDPTKRSKLTFLAGILIGMVFETVVGLIILLAAIGVLALVLA